MTSSSAMKRASYRAPPFRVNITSAWNLDNFNVNRIQMTSTLILHQATPACISFHCTCTSAKAKAPEATKGNVQDKKDATKYSSSPLSFDISKTSSHSIRNTANLRSWVKRTVLLQMGTYWGQFEDAGMVNTSILDKLLPCQHVRSYFPLRLHICRDDWCLRSFPIGAHLMVAI